MNFGLLVQVSRTSRTLENPRLGNLMSLRRFKCKIISLLACSSLNVVIKQSNFCIRQQNVTLDKFVFALFHFPYSEKVDGISSCLPGIVGELRKTPAVKCLTLYMVPGECMINIRHKSYCNPAALPSIVRSCSCLPEGPRFLWPRAHLEQSIQIGTSQTIRT